MSEDASTPTGECTPGQCLMHYLHTGAVDPDIWSSDLPLMKAVPAYLDEDEVESPVAVAELLVLCFASQYPEAAFHVLTTLAAVASPSELAQIQRSCSRMLGGPA